MSQARGTTLKNEKQQKDFINKGFEVLAKLASSTHTPDPPKKKTGSTGKKNRPHERQRGNAASSADKILSQYKELYNALKDAGVKNLAGDKIENKRKPSNNDLLKDAGLVTPSDVFAAVLTGGKVQEPTKRAGNKATLDALLEKEKSDAAARYLGIDPDTGDDLPRQSSKDVAIVNSDDDDDDDDGRRLNNRDPEPIDPYDLLNMYAHTPSEAELLAMLNEGTEARKEQFETANKRSTNQYYDFLAGLGNTLQSTLGLRDTNAIKAGISKGSQDAMEIAQMLGVAQQGSAGALQFAQAGNDILEQYAIDMADNKMKANEMAMAYKADLLTNFRNLYGSDRMYDATIDSAKIAADANTLSAQIAAQASRDVGAYNRNQSSIWDQYFMNNPGIMDSYIKNQLGIKDTTAPKTTGAASVDDILNTYDYGVNWNQMKPILK